MSDIKVQNVSKYFGSTEILRDISFDVFSGEKIAIVGINGAGKSTLFKMIAGEMPYDSGRITTDSYKNIAILSQIPTYDDGTIVEDILDLAFSRVMDIKEQMHSIEKLLENSPSDNSLIKKYGELCNSFEGMNGYNLEFEKEKVLNGMKITGKLRSQLVSKLSGGEQTRINLARIILSQPDILLLDEPTNHLDMDSIEWLSDYLDKYRGTIVTISHDRYFLDKCFTRIIEIVSGSLEFYSGSYSYYAEEKKIRHEQRLEKYKHEQKELRRLQDMARDMHSRGTEKMHKRAFAVEKRIDRLSVSDSPTVDKKIVKPFGEQDYNTEDVLRIKNIGISYDNRKILENINIEVKNGDRIAIVGENGAGKSTLLKIILSIIKPDSGAIIRGNGLKIAYLPQNVSFEDDNRTLVDAMIYEKNVTNQTARNRLGAFKFSGEEQLLKISSLSGGEKSRLKLAMLMYDPINMLILDEPTNHLDLRSREWIEESISLFNGTIIFVSHDRYFISRFANRVIELHKTGEYIDFKGSFDEFLNSKQKNIPDIKPPPKKVSKVSRPSKSQDKDRKRIEREIDNLEKEIVEIDKCMLECANDYLKLQEFMDKKSGIEDILLAKLEELDLLLF